NFFSRGLGANAACSGPDDGDLSGGAPRGRPAAELGGSGREVGKVGREEAPSQRQEEADTVSHLHTGRVGVLDPTPPTIKLEKDVEGV
ncbi:unnamed protein product, partial [Musa acuminata subsp. burmannicoides]